MGTPPPPPIFGKDRHDIGHNSALNLKQKLFKCFKSTVNVNYIGIRCFFVTSRVSWLCIFFTVTSLNIDYITHY